MTGKEKIWQSIGASVVACGILIVIVPREQRTTINIIGIIGFVLSIVGLVIAILQVQSVKEIAEDTRTKVNESLDAYNEILMVSELSSKVAIINEIQDYLKAGKIELCTLRMRDLQKIINSLKTQEQFASMFTKKEFKPLFNAFNIDLDNFETSHFSEDEIDKTVITRNLSALASFLLQVEVKIRTART